MELIRSVFFYFCSAPRAINVVRYYFQGRVDYEYIMLRENLILITLCGLLTTSCAVIKNTSQGQVTKIERGDFEKLNEEFPNYPTTSTGTIISDMVSNNFEALTLWSQLDGFNEVATEETFRQQTVTIDFLSIKKRSQNSGTMER
jgi:hypothetical protein